MLPVRLKALVACAGEAFTLNFCIDLGQLSHLLMHGQENYGLRLHEGSGDVLCRQE